MSAQAAPANATQNAAETGSVLVKLAVFTACLGLAPISTYYLSQKYLWDGNSTYAAITSIIAANFVLVTYIITAVREDAQSQKPVPKAESETKKDR
ncbi:hypothetical protein FS837_001655 [Tulasnella sp. UAMH 9824]|nr:hypothetical protein FRC00_000423 [Tulasnella sp. 408]KAG9036514.1 hypothetical protein FS837_001655 [Tulasnella sp. UAMH 9824]